MAGDPLLCTKMEPVILFLVTTVVSFIGSLQAGLVNTAVLAHTVRWGHQAGRRMAIGGAIPELVYAGAAFAGASWLLHRLGLDRAGIAIVVSSVLILLGIYFVLIYKPHERTERTEQTGGDMRRGLYLGFANPQLLLFWCGAKLSLASFGLTGHGALEMAAFALGAFTGALILLLLLVRLGVRAQKRLSPTALRRMFRLVGAVLMASGVYGLMRAL